MKMVCYDGKLADLIRARKMKKSGSPTCFILVTKEEPENTTIETTTIIGVFSSRELAEKARNHISVLSGEIVEWVIDPPFVDDKDSYFGRKKVLKTACSDGPDWWEDLNTDAEANKIIESDEERKQSL